MSKEQLFIFDTTLRDGAQTQGVDFSVDDKLKIASAEAIFNLSSTEKSTPCVCAPSLSVVSNIKSCSLLILVSKLFYHLCLLLKPLYLKAFR